MRRELNFYREFRTIQQFDYEISDLSKKEQLNNIPIKSGIYIIVSPKTKFIYPNGESKVIYIGKAENIKRRLTEHHNNLSIALNEKCVKKSIAWHFNRYKYMKYHGARVYVFLARGNQDVKQLESDFMVKFYEKYEATPVGNGARSFQHQ